LQPVQVAGLRDIPVLAELAGEIAAGSAEGQNGRAGQEVVQRLLFDRIEAEA
jgi:hypothetical protein